MATRSTCLALCLYSRVRVRPLCPSLTLTLTLTLTAQLMNYVTQGSSPVAFVKFMTLDQASTALQQLEVYYFAYPSPACPSPLEANSRFDHPLTCLVNHSRNFRATLPPVTKPHFSCSTLVAPAERPKQAPTSGPEKQTPALGTTLLHAIAPADSERLTESREAQSNSASGFQRHEAGGGEREKREREDPSRVLLA